MAHSIKQILRRFSQSVCFAEVPPEVRQKIYRLCADFVGGTWAGIRPDDLVIKHIRGGTSNMLFLCALPATNKTNSMNGFAPRSNASKGYNDPCSPKEVLLRIYFNPNTANHVLEESVVFTLLAERKLGPKLYGVFEEGRLEEYIHSRALTTSEIRLPVVSTKIANTLAQIHKLIMPIDKRPVYLQNSMRKWMSELRALYKSKDLKSVVVAQSASLEKVLSLDELEEEIELVIKCVELSPSPIVFCHNDFQEGNILLKESDTNFDVAEFGVIDYEYASYSYRTLRTNQIVGWNFFFLRAFDLANHFCEWTFDYHSLSEHPCFLSTQEHFPTKEQQALFAANYLQGLADCAQLPQSVPVPQEDVQALLGEVKAFVPVSHFFWGVWSLLLSETSPVNFGFTEYGHCRMELYYHLRPDLLALLNNSNGKIGSKTAENGKTPIKMNMII